MIFTSGLLLGVSSSILETTSPYVARDYTQQFFFYRSTEGPETFEEADFILEVNDFNSFSVKHTFDHSPLRDVRRKMRSIVSLIVSC